MYVFTLCVYYFCIVVYLFIVISTFLWLVWLIWCWFFCLNFCLLFFVVVLNFYYFLSLFYMSHFKYETTFWKFLPHFMFGMILDDFFMYIVVGWVLFELVRGWMRKGVRWRLIYHLRWVKWFDFFLNMDWHRCLKVDLV